MKQLRKLSVIATIATSCVLNAGLVSAAEDFPLLERLQQSAVERGGKLTHGLVESRSAEKKVINGLRYIRETNTSTLTAEADKVTIDSQGDTALNATRINSADLGTVFVTNKSAEGEAISGKIKSVEARDLLIPNEKDGKEAPLMQQEQVISSGAAQFKLNEKDYFGWSNAKLESIPNAANSTSRRAFKLENLSLELSSVPVSRQNQQAIANLSELGYDRLNMQVSADTTVDTKLKTISLDNYQIKIDDFADLTINAKLKSENPEEFFQAGSNLLQNIGSQDISKLDIAITDKNALERILALQAKRSGQDTQSVRVILPILAASFLAPFNLPDLATQTRDALTQFMEGGKSLVVSIEPQQAVSGNVIIAMVLAARAGAMQPAELVSQLNLKISAK